MSTTTRWGAALASGAAAFLAADAVWIPAVARRMYDAEIPHLMAGSPRPAPAAAFYTGYLAGLTHLAVRPQDERTPAQRFRDGAVLGALAYGTWGFTGASVLRRFPVRLAAADCAWGSLLSGASAVVAGAVMDRYTPR